MKFSCERCGKRYATAEIPAPGKVYKLQCRACGHLIVVRAAGTSDAVPSQPGASVAVAGVAPALDARGASPLAPGAGDRSTPDASAQAWVAATTERSAAAVPPPPVPAEGELQPPPGDSGWIDLFSDLGPPGAQEALAGQGDPFLAAARASLPEAYGAPAPDPHAPLRQEPPGAAGPAVQAKIPDIPRPPPQKSGLTFGLIGGGFAVLVGILAFVLLGSGRKAPPAPAPAPVQAQTPVAPPAAPPSVPDAPVQVQPPASADQARPPPEPSRVAADDRPRQEERRRREGARAARERRAREARAAGEPAAEEPQAAAASVQDEGDAGLTQAQIEAVLRSTRKAFEGCLRSARGSDPRLDGRRVMLLLNIQRSGTVTYPTLDDVTLNGTDLGSCLKSAARLMVFPRFKGDTLHVEVPLVMR